MPTNINGFVVFGAIEQKWLSIGGPNSPLPRPVTNETPTFDGAGRRQAFEGGLISWHPNIGVAFIVWGLIGARWLEIGGEQFGYPVTDELPTPDGRGRFNHFRAFRQDGSIIGESSIYWSPTTGAHEVYGGIRDFWAVNGWEKSKVGYPINAEHDRSDIPGREQLFENGPIIWSPDPVIGVSFTPAIALRAVSDQGQFVEISGFRFTPNQSVKLSYGISSGGGPTTTAFGEDVITSDGIGNFHHRVPVNLGGDTSSVNVEATDVASGATAQRALP